jgi:hypothetical protein
MGLKTLNRRTIAVLAACAVVAVGVSVDLAVQAGSGHATVAATAPTGTAAVTRTDLSTTQQVNGTLGFDGSYTVVNLVGTTSAQRATAQAQLAQALAQQAAGNQAAADARATAAAQTAADQTQLEQLSAAVAADQRQLAADQDQQSRDNAAETTDCAVSTTPACTVDRTAVTADNTRVSADQTALTRDQQSAAQSQGKVAVDQAQGRQSADAAAAQAGEAGAQANAIQNSGSTTAPTTITWVPQVGDTVVAGQRLYALDGRPVVLLTGNTAILRPLAVGVPDGPDVAVLKQNLATLGFSPGPVDQHFDAATAAAVRAWQAALGEQQDGTVHLGDVFVEPTSVRVTGVNVTPGSAANPGNTVLTGTSTTPVVTVPLTPAKEYLVHTGDAVMIDLPDGKTTTTGHIRTISRVATGSGSSGGSSGGNGGSGSGTGGSSGGSNIQSQQQGQQALAANSTVSVTVTLDNPAAVHVLDQAPVQVDITDQTVRGVLAVPVNALLALAGGGYGLQLLAPSGVQTVTVQVGLFGNGLVQVSGSGVVAGATVVVPAS